MLDRAHRLRRSGDFSTTVRRGRRAARETVVVHYQPSGDSAHPPRAGFVVSRAVGGAVLRNRVRRRLRHLVFGYLDRFPTGATLVVRARPAAAGANWQQLAADLRAALDRAGAATESPPPGR